MTSNRINSATVLFLFVCATGCAIHRQSIQTYRLVPEGANNILVPPGVASVDLDRRTFNTDVAAVRGKCPSSPEPIAIEKKRKRTRVTVRREALLKQPAGWLSEWTADLESQGCIAPGAGTKLAEQIVETLPLDMNQALHLLYSNQLDITPRMAIQVVSPILREGAAPGGPILESVETSGNGHSLTATMKSSANLLGYETAAYAVQPKTGGIGISIVPLYADRHIGDQTERRPEPAANYFRFSGNAAFYRVFYEAKQTEYAALVIAAPTRAELETRTKVLEAGAASCEKLNNELCSAVPKEVAINGLVSVTVNGQQTPVSWGTTVGGILRTAGPRDTNSVLPKLAVYKLYGSKPIAVEFDHATPAILSLVVTGGEVISWK
jgi:hypothetical protein